MDSKNSEESGALADEKKAEEEQHMDLKDAIERENQDTKTMLWLRSRPEWKVRITIRTI